MRIGFWGSKKTISKHVSQESIMLGNKLLSYTLTRNPKARHLRISIKYAGALHVTSPLRLSQEKIEHFILEKESWILPKIDYFKSLPKQPTPQESQVDYETHKEQARILVHKKIASLNAHYNFSYNTIRIKNHSTLWGSCSRKRNLNFNYRIVYLKEKFVDYIIVHELCHLQEFNHSSDFWELVAKVIPNHKAIRKELRILGIQSK
jgi:predicted metal-dependent hydrolase